ncbi:hypothetical protein KBD61_05830 [Patescibacteria group bacterium]|nr:hypothetical protein [Patescibacteria group bacterium]MBP9710508.1 hypothetical protein [Patescibacteria group bacterium]
MPSSSTPSSWKENIGFPCVGIGILLPIITGYTWLEGGPPITGYPYEVAASIVISASLILFGLFLTWPRSKQT